MFTPKRITKARCAAGLSRSDFVGELYKHGKSVSFPTVYRWETGLSLPDVHEIEIIADVLKKPVEYFFN